jgi:hypothetical protein
VEEEGREDGSERGRGDSAPWERLKAGGCGGDLIKMAAHGLMTGSERTGSERRPGSRVLASDVLSLFTAGRA